MVGIISPHPVGIGLIELQNSGEAETPASYTSGISTSKVYVPRKANFTSLNTRDDNSGWWVPGGVGGCF